MASIEFSKNVNENVILREKINRHRLSRGFCYCRIRITVTCDANMLRLINYVKMVSY